jgi:hypothetical protein
LILAVGRVRTTTVSAPTEAALMRTRNLVPSWARVTLKRARVAFLIRWPSASH